VAGSRVDGHVVARDVLARDVLALKAALDRSHHVAYTSQRGE